MGMRCRWGAVVVGVFLVGTSAGCGGPAVAGPQTFTPSAAAGTPGPASASPGAGSSPSSGARGAKPAGVIFAAFQGADWLVESVDPVTGAVSEVADFLPAQDNVHLSSEYTTMTGGGPLIQRELFSADLTRAVAIKLLSDGTSHIGWIDRDGVFTDVTAATSSTGGFASTTSDDTPSFGPDGGFYFARRKPDGSISTKTLPDIWRLAGTNPAQARQVQTLDQINYYIDAPSRIMSLCAGCSPFFSPAGQDRGAFRATGFIGSDSYLSTDADGTMIYRSPLKAESDTDLMDWGTGGKALIPQTNRKVWSPVASPDGTQVAFLSKGVDQVDPTIAPQLFIVPSQGGTPQAVTITSGDLHGTSPTLIGWL
jgi:hypothetical protein